MSRVRDPSFAQTLAKRRRRHAQQRAHRPDVHHPIVQQPQQRRPPARHQPHQARRHRQDQRRPPPGRPRHQPHQRGIGQPLRPAERDRRRNRPGPVQCGDQAGRHVHDMDRLHQRPAAPRQRQHRPAGDHRGQPAHRAVVRRPMDHGRVQDHGVPAGRQDRRLGRPRRVAIRVGQGAIPSRGAGHHHPRTRRRGVQHHLRKGRIADRHDALGIRQRRPHRVGPGQAGDPHRRNPQRGPARGVARHRHHRRAARAQHAAQHRPGAPGGADHMHRTRKIRSHRAAPRPR